MYQLVAGDEVRQRGGKREDQGHGHAMDQA